MEKDIIAKELDKLEKLYTEMEKLHKEQEKLIEALLSPETKKAIKEVHDEFGPKLEAVMLKIASISKMIEEGTLELEESVSGEKEPIRAIFQPGKVSWDGKALMVYPNTTDYGILRLRKVGKPNVRITRKR